MKCCRRLLTTVVISLLLISFLLTLPSEKPTSLKYSYYSYSTYDHFDIYSGSRKLRRGGGFRTRGGFGRGFSFMRPKWGPFLASR